MSTENKDVISNTYQAALRPQEYTMQFEVQHLQGTALNWAVYLALYGETPPVTYTKGEVLEPAAYIPAKDPSTTDIFFAPSTKWAQFGPVMQNQQIAICPVGPGLWAATEIGSTRDGDAMLGSCPMVAGCRALVFSRIGPVINIPVVLANNIIKKSWDRTTDG